METTPETIVEEKTEIKLLEDNGLIILPKIKNKQARFIRQEFDKVMYYLAANRAARRFLRSKHITKFAKNNGLEIDLEMNAIA